MLGNAFVLAVVSAVGGIFIFKKLPKKVQDLLIKHGLFTDLAAAIGVYILFGTTATALIAAGIVGIITSAMLEVAKNKEDFLYLYDAWDWARTQMQQAKQLLSAQGEAYRTRKGQIMEATLEELQQTA